MDDNQKACLGFSLCYGVGPMTFIALVAHFGSPHIAYNAKSSELKSFFRLEKYFNSFIESRAKCNRDESLKKLHKLGIWVITQYDSDYPALLKNIVDPPICIFGKGDRNSINFNTDTCVGVVGARKPTPYGIYVAEELGRSFANEGLVIVSGMASGIDTISHRAAIEKQGRTIAVLGTDITIIYPPENRELHNKILKEYGIVISEYPPGFPVHRGMFVLRNRIIVGLSKAIVVVEGGEHSGSLTTARFAAENGRDVYAVPGPITSEMSAGPHILLREGAHVLTSSHELLRDFGLKSESTPITKQDVHLTGSEKIIYDLLSVKKYHVDEIAKKISVSVSDVLILVSLLEVRGIIGKGADGAFTALV